MKITKEEFGMFFMAVLFIGLIIYVSSLIVMDVGRFKQMTELTSEEEALMSEEQKMVLNSARSNLAGMVMIIIGAFFGLFFMRK